MTPPITDRDAAIVQRLWANRELSDADVDRAIDELGLLVEQRDEAKRIVARLAEVWPRDTLREAEAFLAETADPEIKPAPGRRRW